MSENDTMRSIDYFQQIYIINLPHRADRRREVGYQLEKIGLSFSAPNICLFPAVLPNTPAGFPSIHARGLFLSHLKVLRDAYSRGFQRILILEDHINLASDFSKRIVKVAAELELYDWSIFYGGCSLEVLPELTNRGELLPIWPSESILTSHFMGFRGPTIGEIVTFFQNLLAKSSGDYKIRPKHIDEAYNRFRQNFPYKLTLLAIPELAYIRSSNIAIHDPRWFDRMPLVNFTVTRLRRLRKPFSS
jgi:glycosyl transferase, family 25